MQLTNTKRYTERKLLGAMLGTGVINRRECIEETGIDPANFCRQASEYMREIGFGGYFFRRGGRILCQRTNIYGYSCDLISMYRRRVAKQSVIKDVLEDDYDCLGMKHLIETNKRMHRI